MYVNITNNTVCGQAVSMKSIRETAKIAEKYDIPFMFDVARWAENAYFIKVNEEGSLKYLLAAQLTGALPLKYIRCCLVECVMPKRV